MNSVASPPLSLKRQVFYLSLPLLITLGLLELCFRIAGYQPLTIYSPHRYPNTPQAYYAISDQTLGFRNRANGAYHYQLIKGNPLSTTDSYGYRNGIGWTEDATTPIILFVGDSTLFAAEVNDHETITSEIAKLLSPQFKIRILNAGVRGYNTLQAKRMMAECLERFPMIKLVVYMYCNNDYYHNFNPFLYPTPAPTVRWENTGEDVLVEVEIENPQIPWGESFYTPLNGESGKSQHLILTHQKISTRKKITNYLRSKSALFHQIGLRVKKLLASQNIAADDLVSEEPKSPSHNDTVPFFNWNVTQQAINTQIEDQVKWVKQHRGDETLEILLRQMRESAEEKGATFVATAFSWGGAPLKGEILDALYDEFPIRCHNADVTFINVIDAFKKDDHLSYFAKTNDGDYDGHYNAKGTRTFARGLAPELIPIIASMFPESER